MSTSLNTELFSSMVRIKRGKSGLRQAAQEIGEVSAATMSRIEQGSIPDVDTFIRICNWLGEPADTFIVKSESKHAVVDNHQRIVAHLRSDKQLRPATVEMLIKVIELAYSNS